MIVIISVISFLLDGIISKYTYNTIFLNLFTISSLVLIYPYFKNNYFRYFRYIAILGLLYDIVYTNTLFFNMFIFMIIGLIITLFFYFLSNNWYINTTIGVISIIVYRFITYLFFSIFSEFDFNILILFKSIYCSIILNVIYFLFVYILTEIYSNNHKIIRSR